MSNEEKILYFLRIRGPSLPSQIAKFINQNILLTSAMLSDLISQGKIKISHLKIDGSPLYFLPGQESSLQNFVSSLNGKDQKTLEMLKEKKVIADAGSDLLIRVSLRNLKDFAKPMEVKVGNETRYFFRWYLISNEEADQLIKKELGLIEEKKEKESEIKEETKPLEKKEEIEELKVGEIEKKEKIKRAKKEVQKAILKKEDFLNLVKAYFNENKISINEVKIIKKSEINFLVEVPSPIGKITYFSKAINKKSCTEKDLSAAILEGQIRKLPVLFLYSGELNRKGEELVNKGFENLVVKKI